MNQPNNLIRAYLFAVAMLFCIPFIATAQNEETIIIKEGNAEACPPGSSLKATVTIKMTDEEGNTTVKKIVRTGDESEIEKIQELVEEEIGDFQGEVEVDVDVQQIAARPSGEEENEENEFVFEEEEIEVTVDGDNIFINGEKVEEGEFDGKKVIIIKTDDEDGSSTEDIMEKIESTTEDGHRQIRIMRMDGEDDMDEILEDMDIKIEEIMGGEGEKQIKIIKKRIGDGAMNENRPYLGVQISNVDEGKGVYIEEVMDSGAAKKAGLQKGDIIRTINAQPTNNYQSLIELMNDYKIGDQIDIQYTRDGQTKSTKALLGKKPDMRKVEVHKYKGQGGSWTDLNGKTYRLKKDNCCKTEPKPRLGVTIENAEEDGGARVISVAENSAADRAGLLANDVIIKVNKEKIGDIDDLIDEVQDYEIGDEIKIQYIRGNKKTATKATLAAAAMTKNGSCCPPNCCEGKSADRKVEIIIEDGEEETITETIIEEDINILPENTLSVSTFELYPNPTSGQVTIKFETPEKMATRVSIVDLAGKEVFTEEMPNFSGVFNKKIDLSDSNEGIYFLKIQQGAKVFTEKIIVNQ